LAQNATSLATGAAIAAQILVQSATGVTITNITVDGANHGINGCGLDPIGIYYHGTGLTGCQAGLGIFANFQKKNGITGNEVGTSVTITANDVIGQGPTNGAAENAPRGSQLPN
jgi:hypothetical protein